MALFEIFSKTPNPKEQLKSTIHKLKSRIQERLHEDWINYLLSIEKDHGVGTHLPSHLKNPPNNEGLTSIINSHLWSRAKEHFSWSLIFDFSDFNYSRSTNIYLFSLNISRHIDELVAEIESKSPSYGRIREIIKRIKTIPIQWTGQTSPLYIENFPYGKNGITSFFASIEGLLFTPVWAILGILALPFYYASMTLYLGSPTFLLDCMNHFFKSLVNLVSILCFPIAMYQSKQETGSSNICKRDFLRRLDSIEHLASKLAPPSDIDIFNVINST